MCPACQDYSLAVSVAFPNQQQAQNMVLAVASSVLKLLPSTLELALEDFKGDINVV